MRTSLYAFAACLLLNNAIAQERCTSTSLTQRWLDEQGWDGSLHDALGHVQQGQRGGGGTPTIAVAVHVVWNTAAENVADAVIEDMIATMNEDYQALNSDWDNVRPQFESDRANPDILFCLAQVDPNGDPTTGITRTQTSQTWFDPDTETNDMKSAPDGYAPWDPYHYLNIWICDISSGLGGGLITAGYAYLPVGGMVGSDIDGIVVDFDYGLGAGSRTATHEAGHYLGLDHPWGDGGCGSTDGMDDTPTTDEATFSCSNTGLMNCGLLTQYENFMDYADCSLMFTNDQSAFMNAILSGARAELLTTNACGSVTPGPCIPTSAVGTAEDDFVDGVQLGSINNVNSGSNTGPSYTDYTGQYSTSLQQGSSQTLTVTSGDYTPDHYAAWIDYDQDDTFEAAEKLGEWVNTAAGEGHAFNFTVPVSAAAGSTVMRVRGVYFLNGEPDPMDPCYGYTYGETEDYGITITTNGGGGPCIPTSAFGTSDGDFVDGVELGSIDNTATGSSTGNTYQDYTGQSTDLTRGNAYTLTVTSGEYEEDIIGAWIDYDADDTFEAGEFLGEFITSTPFEPVDLDFIVPMSATLGTTRMRVRCMYPDDGEPTNADPCFSFSWGETEDYSVVIETNVGLSAAALPTFVLYPNPVDGALNVALPMAGGRIEILDLSGRVVLQQIRTSGFTQLDVSGLADGRYLLRWIVDAGARTASFSVAHMD